MADFLTVFTTVISGVLVYVFGQTIQNFILKPLQDFNAVKLDISHRLKFHSNIVTNSGLRDDITERARGDMRDMACNLESKYLMIPFRWVFTLIRIVPTKPNVRDATTRLIRLSNAGGDAGHEVANNDDVTQIKKVLGLEL